MPQYILLPRRGLKAIDRQTLETLIPLGGARSTALPIEPQDPVLRSIGLCVIDSVHEDGPKLVELSAEAVEKLEAYGSELRLEPLRTYRIAIAMVAAVNPPPGASAASPMSVRVECAQTGVGIAGARVTAFTNFTSSQGDEAVTDATGAVDLHLGGTVVAVDKVYVTSPLVGYWGTFRSGGHICHGDVLRIEKVTAIATNVLTHFYGATPQRASSEIVVGVIDTGIGPHADLSVQGGINATVQGEPETDYADNGIGHGTHVAGILAGDGASFKGVAPGVTLRSYRVFAQGRIDTTNYAIVKALIYAADDGCDIVNLSLTGESRSDPTLNEALNDAKRRGTLVVIAAGNEFRKPIGYPAAYVDQTGFVVSAMGRDECFPVGACEVDAPAGTDPHDFVAPFTNIGPGTNSGAQVSVIAPGVGVISTVPGGYGVMSGTSMAAPAVSGMVARLLTQDLSAASPVLRRARDSQRVINMIQMINSAAKPLGFGPRYEGRGLVS